MKLLLTGTSFLPSYGGPAHSVSRLAVALADAGMEVGLWAPDGSAATSGLLPSGARVRRLEGVEAAALEAFADVDLLHDNGIWLPHNHRLARLARNRGVPRVVSPRGMLEPWALRHKRWKKSLAWVLYQRRDLASADCLHATSEREAGNLMRSQPRAQVRLVPNGVDVPPPIEFERPGIAGTRDTQPTRTALFLGRIHPVKGLSMLVEAWARVAPRNWVLRIAGPDEAGHRAEVESAVADAGLSEAVSFAGPLDAKAKRRAFLQADLFVLPTHTESFGMAIGEALAHGLPVLTTTGAPWPQLTERRCGWRVDPTAEAIADALRQATSCDLATLRGMGEKGRALVAAEFGWDRVASRFIGIYAELTGK
ncbi:glycosyltransferase [Microbaculum marinum]|uniref:Glycosyltransferase n=1 Tax=Microbaculum marinum TaxID=1764581 RepID=A0AAW9RGN1_9HYPH